MRTPHMPPMSVPEKKQKYSLPLCAQRDMHMGSLDKQPQHTHTIVTELLLSQLTNVGKANDCNALVQIVKHNALLTVLPST